MKPLMDRVVYFVVRIFVAVIQMFPLHTCSTLAAWVTWLAVDVLKFRHRVIDENLRRAFPNMPAGARKDMSREMWEHLVLMICEIVQVPRKIHETNWRKYVRIHNKKRLTSYLIDERPTVLLSAHFGNFELAGVTAGLLGFRTHTVARDLDNQHVSRFFQGLRESKGQYMLPKEGSAPMVSRVLDAQGIIALLGDQYAGPKGCWVDFFGHPTSYHKAVAVFPLTAQAPLVITYAKRVGGPLQFEVGLSDVLDPKLVSRKQLGINQVTEWYSRTLEGIVRETPSQYWWLHRRWKADPPKRFAKPRKAA
jgi:Kdo2-lipid IVA lauroyltransferase/acyltransferase